MPVTMVTAMEVNAHLPRRAREEKHRQRSAGALTEPGTAFHQEDEAGDKHHVYELQHCGCVTSTAHYSLPRIYRKEHSGECSSASQ